MYRDCPAQIKCHFLSVVSLCNCHILHSKCLILSIRQDKLQRITSCAFDLLDRNPLKMRDRLVFDFQLFTDHFPKRKIKAIAAMRLTFIGLRETAERENVFKLTNFAYDNGYLFSIFDFCLLQLARIIELFLKHWFIIHRQSTSRPFSRQLNIS